MYLDVLEAKYTVLGCTYYMYLNVLRKPANPGHEDALTNSKNPTGWAVERPRKQGKELSLGVYLTNFYEQTRRCDLGFLIAEKTHRS